MRALRGSNAAAVIARLNPIIRGWAAYYRGVVSSKVFPALDNYMWKLTYKWAKHSHHNKPKTWVVARYFGKFNKFRNDRWVFGDPRRNDAVTSLPVKFSWTDIVRHQMVNGAASPDDPALTDYWAKRRRTRQTPAGQLHAAPARQAGRPLSALRGPPARRRPATTIPTRMGTMVAAGHPQGDPTTTSSTTAHPDDPAHRTVTKPAWCTPPANAALRARPRRTPAHQPCTPAACLSRMPREWHVRF